MKTKRPIAEVLRVVSALLEELAPFCERIQIAGSLRRECPEVGDIELVAIPKLEEKTVTQIEADLFGDRARSKTVKRNLLWEYLDEVEVPAYTKKGEKYRQFMLRDFQIDLFTAEAANWGWIYLIRTGSADFSHRMASVLSSRGYTSEEGYIRRKGDLGERISTPDEADVFRLAGMNHVPPNQRTQ